MGSQFSVKRHPPHQVSPPYSRTTSASPSFPSRPDQVIRIDVLPDDVLLDVFDFYVRSSRYGDKSGVEAWQPLVHVCRRWRSLILGSPRRLNLQLYCTPKTPARDTLDVWPALPLIVEGNMTLSYSSTSTDDVMAALRQSDRVCQVDLLGVDGRTLEEFLTVMQVPFPELTMLRLWSYYIALPVIPADSFLDGSAPRLRFFSLERIPFPGLPKFLLSSNHLVQLRLFKIPHSGYFSPEAIVALLPVLPSLDNLILEFESPQSHPDWETRPLPPSKRYVIPALTSLHFKGVVEYLEDLVTFNDTPQLDELEVHFFNQVNFDIPRLAQFINRTPKLTNRDVALLIFEDNFVRVEFPSGFRTFKIAISCKEPDWQLSSIEQVCNSSLYLLSTTVEDLYVEHRFSVTDWIVWNDKVIEKTQLLQLLLPFTAVKNLYLYHVFAPGIATTLNELVVGRVTEVLPSLQNIFVKGFYQTRHFQEDIGEFVAARQLSDHPITISQWSRDSDSFY